jgi:hypothetical protein
MDGDVGGCVGWFEAGMLDEPMDGEVDMDDPFADGIDDGDDIEQPVAWAITTDRSR